MELNDVLTTLTKWNGTQLKGDFASIVRDVFTINSNAKTVRLDWNMFKTIFKVSQSDIQLRLKALGYTKKTFARSEAKLPDALTPEDEKFILEAFDNNRNLLEIKEGRFAGGYQWRRLSLHASLNRQRFISREQVKDVVKANR